MDIASRPSEPVANFETADAATPPHVSATIRREDYRPPAWLVPEIALAFDLGIDETRVVANLKVAHNPAAAPDRGAAAQRRRHRRAQCKGRRRAGRQLADGRQRPAGRPSRCHAHHVEIETLLQPAGNSQLMGLYASNGMLCTQCEAEGFRRIAFFPDRPGRALGLHRAHGRPGGSQFPVLLSNGNCIAQG